MERKSKKIMPSNNESKNLVSNIDKNLPIYISASILYPKEELRSHIVNFRQILYKNFLNTPEEEKSLQSILMTSFGFEFDLIKPIVDNGIQVAIKF